MNELQETLDAIAKEFTESIDPTSIVYTKVNLRGALARHNPGTDRHHNVHVIVPIGRVTKMTTLMMVSGDYLSDHIQLSTGLVVPFAVAEEAELKGQRYNPHTLMYETSP